MSLRAVRSVPSTVVQPVVSVSWQPSLHHTTALGALDAQPNGVWQLWQRNRFGLGREVVEGILKGLDELGQD